jgi:hypothetical protein
MLSLPFPMRMIEQQADIRFLKHSTPTRAHFASYRREFTHTSAISTSPVINLRSVPLIPISDRS